MQNTNTTHISAPSQTKSLSPNLTLLVVGVISMVTVLSTLVGTQVYIQTQENLRNTKQINSEKFLELIKTINPDSYATNAERQQAILALGGINDAQSIEFLVDLLVKETNFQNIDTIQQALINIGLVAIPELKQMHLFLLGELEPGSNFRQIRERQLKVNQQTINKILSVYSGKVQNLDLSNTQLSQNNVQNNSEFRLVLKNADLSGAIFTNSNLNNANFQGSSFRSVGEDKRWDTYDDVTANLIKTLLRLASVKSACCN
ncbi:MAG: pentapeptide repeat-containing protein [Sphaerospermopsis sp. SIO1G2]|nr:pentapeptide repeat-containing protein [Sphaerospermopsis sp. SIO1G2]